MNERHLMLKICELVRLDNTTKCNLIVLSNQAFVDDLRGEYRHRFCLQSGGTSLSVDSGLS